MKAAARMLVTMSTRLVLALAVFGMASASRGQEAKPKPSDDVKSRQERIENGIEPVELGNGQEPAKLSLAELMKLYKDPGLTVAVSAEKRRLRRRRCFKRGRSVSRWQRRECWRSYRRENSHSTKT